MKRTHPTSHFLLTLATAAIVLPLSLSVAAEDKTRDIKPGDTLGAIVSQEYPGYDNRQAIMEAILKANPDAFVSNNLNLMTVGKTLKLPAADTIPELQPPPPPSATTDQSAQEKLQALQTERDNLTETVALLKDENAQLKELVQGFEKKQTAAPTTPTETEAATKETQTNQTATATGDMAELQQKVATLEGENTELQTQLETAKMDLSDNQAQTEELKKQLAELQKQPTSASPATGSENQTASTTGNTAELQQKITTLEGENTELQTQLETVKMDLGDSQAEAEELKKQLAGLQQQPADGSPATDNENQTVVATGDTAELQQKIAALEGEKTEFQTQLETAKMDLGDSQAQAEEVKTQLADLQRQNDALSNDLQQARAATAVAESKAANSNRLPWILLGLMALLMLPLLWLLKRYRDEPSITTLPAAQVQPVSIQPTAPTPAAVSTPVTRSLGENEQVVEREPENPDADLKLDIARAYLDLRNPEAAAEILKDVITEGGSRQQQEAREILSFIS